MDNDKRLAFENFLNEWTGKDISYHIYYKTTGLEFAWVCFQKGMEYAKKNKLN